MATIDKHYGNWRARVRKNSISRTKTFTKKSDAALWAAETERAITLGLPLGGDDGATLALILQRYARETARKEWATICPAILLHVSGNHRCRKDVTDG